MATLNKVMQIGRCISDPEPPRILPGGGSTVVKFRLAVGRNRKNQQTGQWEPDPNQLYIDVEVWHRQEQKRNLCDVVSRFVTKGKEVYVEGRLQLDEWEDKNGGGKRSKHKIVADTIELLGGRDQQDEPQPQQAQQGYGQRSGGYDAPADDGPHGDGIPF